MILFVYSTKQLILQLVMLYHTVGGNTENPDNRFLNKHINAAQNEA